jgi:hypothetical protein
MPINVQKFTEQEATIARMKLPNVRIMVGSNIGGVLIPCVLVAVRTFYNPGIETFFDETPPRNAIIGAILFFSLHSTTLLALAVLRRLLKLSKDWTLGESMVRGACYGAALNFVNLPLYSVISLLNGDELLAVRVIILFAVSGSLWGTWIGWHAWKAWHPEEHFFPRFSLRTLILVVLLWGGVMLMFQPRPALKITVTEPAT